jgi:hypothetical protein
LAICETIAPSRWRNASTLSGPATRSSVRRILRVAAEHFDELVEVWEKMHE